MVGHDAGRSNREGPTHYSFIADLRQPTVRDHGAWQPPGVGEEEEQWECKRRKCRRMGADYNTSRTMETPFNKPLRCGLYATGAHTTTCPLPHFPPPTPVIIEESDGMITVSGGKWTTYRAMAQEAVDAAVATGRMPQTVRQCRTERLPLLGAGPELSAGLLPAQVGRGEGSEEGGKGI